MISWQGCGESMKALMSIICLLVLVYLIYQNFGDKELDIVISGENYSVENKDYNYQYKLNKDMSKVEGVAVFSQYIEDPIEYGGTLIRLMYLDKKAVKLHEQKHGKNAACPAPFLNKYGREKWIYAFDSSIVEQILSIELPNYNDPSTWKKISIKGKCVEKQISGIDKSDNQSLMLPNTHFNACRSFVVFNLIETPYLNIDR